MQRRTWLAGLVVGLLIVSGLSMAVIWLGSPPVAPAVRTAPAIQWTAERPWFPNYSSPVQVSSSASSNYSDGEIQTALTLEVEFAWPPLYSLDEFNIFANLSTRLLHGTGTGTTLTLATDVGSVSFDPFDPANVTSSGYDAPTKTSFLVLRTTTAPLRIWWHLGGTRQAFPRLQGTVQVGYAVSGLPRIVAFPVDIALRDDSSTQAPLNMTLPFASNAFIGDWDTTDLYRFDATVGDLLQVNVSHLWVYNTSIEVTLLGPQGPIVNETFAANGVDSGFTMMRTLPISGRYVIEIAAAYPMFYQLNCAILA